MVGIELCNDNESVSLLLYKVILPNSLTGRREQQALFKSPSSPNSYIWFGHDDPITLLLQDVKNRYYKANMIYVVFCISMQHLSTRWIFFSLLVIDPIERSVYHVQQTNMLERDFFLYMFWAKIWNMSLEWSYDSK